VLQVGYEIICDDCGFREYTTDREEAEDLVEEHVEENPGHSVGRNGGVHPLRG